LLPLTERRNQETEGTMDDGIGTMHRLLQEIVEHLKSEARSDKTAAAQKLRRISSLATTLAFTIQASAR